MKEFVSYLKGLKFDPKLKDTFHAKYIQNTRVILLLVFFIIAVGIVTLQNLPRRLNPEINLTIVQVTTVLPGAGPEDVESLLTIPIEDKIAGVKGIDTLTSTSGENVSSIFIQFVSGTDKDKAKTDVQNAVAEVTNLPKDALSSSVIAFDFENQPIWNFAVTSKSDNQASLMRYSESLKKKIEDLPHVDHVALSGNNIQEIQVLLDQSKIQQFGLNPLAVSQAIKASTQAYPAGNVDTGNYIFSLALESQTNSIEDIRNLRINVAGQTIKLGDIATVAETSKFNTKNVYLVKPHQKLVSAVTFAVYKSSSADIVKTVTEVENIVNSDVKASPGSYNVETITNAGEEINKQFVDLIGEFESTLLLVFIALLLFLGVRQALIAIMTIPLTFLLSFVWMRILGQSINFISLFALLLAFGTSIDDTIVTVSAMTSYNRTKKFTALETGLLVWRDFIVPIWTTTVTTVWAFLPLILSTGIIGEFIKPIPLVVATTMYSSTFIVWFITLPIMVVILNAQIPRRVKILLGILGFLLVTGIIILISPKNILMVPILIVFILLLFVFYKVRKNLSARFFNHLKRSPKLKNAISFVSQSLSHGVINTEKLSEKYRQLIARILGSTRNRRVVLICLASFALVSYALVPLGLVKNEFFPGGDADTITLTVETPTGSDLKNLTATTRSILQDLNSTPKLKSAVAEVGTTQNTSTITLILEPKETRGVESSVLTTKIRKKYENYPKAKISLAQASNGPPAGADVQIKILGPDLNELNSYADQTIAFLKKQPGLTNVDKSIKGGTSKIVFIPEPEKLSQAGITIDQVGLTLRTFASGLTLDQVKFNNQDKDVSFYFQNGIPSPQTIGNLSISTLNGQIPLLSLGHLELKNNPTIITRESQKRTISIVASVLPGFSTSDANKKLEKFATTDLNLTSEYSWQTGGVNEENQKSVNSIFQAMALSFLLIMATMIIEFRSYRQAGMILTLIPLAISGVFIVFGLSGTPLSFPALIGVLALFGIVVTNGMFIVEKINQNRKNGMTLVNSIADAGQSRLEPILLTSLTSILGLVPITIANPLWRGLGGAIISGLLFSGVIMLFFIPVAYYFLFRERGQN